MPEQRRQWTAELLTLAPETSRGEHLYSNANYVVAGAMLEEVTGQQWEDLMQEHVFAPLGMTSTGGWAKKDLLYCVSWAWDQTSEHFKVSSQLFMG